MSHIIHGHHLSEEKQQRLSQQTWDYIPSFVENSRTQYWAAFFRVSFKRVSFDSNRFFAASRGVEFRSNGTSVVVAHHHNPIDSSRTINSALRMDSDRITALLNFLVSQIHCAD